MTFAPKRPCKSPGCSALVAVNEGTYCPVHRRSAPSTVNRQLSDRHRGSAASRGYDADWQRARFAFLARYPLCVGVLLPTAAWTMELAIEFHHLREQEREQGRLLIFHHHGTTAQRAGSGVVSSWLNQNPIYRIERWDVARPATVVDHIVPHKGDHLLMWAEWNWQPLTKRAHDRKTATEQGTRNFNTEAAEIAE